MFQSLLGWSHMFLHSLNSESYLSPTYVMVLVKNAHGKGLATLLSWLQLEFRVRVRVWGKGSGLGSGKAPGLTG